MAGRCISLTKNASLERYLQQVFYGDDRGLQYLHDQSVVRAPERVLFA